MNKILKNIGLFILLVILAWPLTYVASWIYGNIVTHPLDITFLAPDPKMFAGFLMSIMFVASLYIGIVLNMRIGLILVAIFIVLFNWIFWGAWSEDLLIISTSSILGWLLGEGILWLYKKLKK